MELKKRVEQLLARIAAMQIPIYAGNASFFLLLSVFPIVSLLLSLLPYTPLTLEHLLGFCAQLAPDWLMRLLEYFERHDVTLLVCSNNINTRISTSKIIIQVLAIIAEFERDILTERIQDNLMELAKDGRWLGGKTPTGFSSQRVTTGSGKNKSAISFLVPVP